MSVVIIAAIAAGALAAQWRSTHMPRRTINDAEIDKLLHELPAIVPDKWFTLETDALLNFGENLFAECGDYFSDMIRDEAAVKDIREAAGDLLSALHLPTLKRAYDSRELSALIAVLQRLHRLRATHLFGDPKDDSACILLQSGISWLKAVRHRANAIA